MASNIRGRSGSRSGSWGSTGSRTTSSRRTTSTGSYRNCVNTFQNKINSFRTLCNQTKGTAGRFGKPAPATLNTFANWINKGAVVQTCSCAQLARWAKSCDINFNTKNPTPAACKKVLTKKFGKPAIKAVARTKTGGFMVATSATRNGKSFCFPR